MLITMNVNGKKVDIDVSYDEYLVDTLRRIGNLSVKKRMRYRMLWSM